MINTTDSLEPFEALASQNPFDAPIALTGSGVQHRPSDQPARGRLRVVSVKVFGDAATTASFLEATAAQLSEVPGAEVLLAHSQITPSRGAASTEWRLLVSVPRTSLALLHGLAGHTVRAGRYRPTVPVPWSRMVQVRYRPGPAAVKLGRVLNFADWAAAFRTRFVSRQLKKIVAAPDEGAAHAAAHSLLADRLEGDRVLCVCPRLGFERLWDSASDAVWRYGSTTYEELVSVMRRSPCHRVAPEVRDLSLQLLDANAPASEIPDQVRAILGD